MEPLHPPRPKTTWTILLVEDDDDLADIMVGQLQKQDYHVVRVSDGHKAQELIEQEKFHLFLFDWMIPGPQGPELCRYVQKKYPLPPPIMMITAKAAPEFIVEGLDSGADDYITKPFTMEVFMARVRVHLRRGHPPIPSPEQSFLQYGNFLIHEGKHEVTLHGKILNLTMSEFKILKSLMEKPGHVYTRKQLIEKMSGNGIHVGGRTIDTQIVGLRKKLGDEGSLVETIRGVGYRFRELES
jgi:two-component system alkaline phosphatase synthesis response regulator PhoP